MADKAKKQEEIQDMVPVDEALPTTTQDVVPMNLIKEAINGGVDVEKLERLFDLQERWEKQQARKAYYQAMARFQADVPTISKNKTVSFDKTSYNYADLPSIAQQIKASLEGNGFSYRWAFTEENGLITCDCILTHVDGHSESSPMSAPADTTGSKNAIQSIGSTRTYLQRYTLIGVAALTTADEDNDGRGAPATTTGTRKAHSNKPTVDKKTLFDDMERLFNNPAGILQIKCGAEQSSQLKDSQLPKLRAFVTAYDNFQKECKACSDAELDEMVTFYLSIHEIDDPEVGRTDLLIAATASLHYRRGIDRASQTMDETIYAAIYNNILGPVKAKNLDELNNDRLKALFDDLVKAFKEA